MNKYRNIQLKVSIIVSTSIFILNPVQAAMTRKKAEVVTIKQLLTNAEKKSQNSKAWSKKNQIIPKPSENIKFKSTAKNFEKISPPNSSNYYARSGTDLAGYENLLDKQIQELFNLTKKFQNSPKRGDMWLRLAELYVEKSDLIEIQLQTNYEKALKDYLDGKRKSKPILNVSPATEYNKKSVKLYEWFLKDFPNDSRAPQALYFLGYNYFSLGNVKSGKKYYEELVKSYPRSVYIGESHFALGDYYFDLEQWANAYREYAHIIKDKQHKMNQIAVYKGAWCLYRLGKGQQAISYLESLLNSSDKSNLRIANDALRDLVVFYAEYGDPSTAADYFEKIVGKDYLKFIERLAYYYSDKGYKDHSRDLFKRIIAADPMSEKAFDYQYQIVQNYNYTKDLEKYKSELFILVKNYSSQSEWGEKNSSKVELVSKANKSRELVLRNFILHNHQTAQNSKAGFSRKIVLESYPVYFEHFPNSSIIVDMHFYYGEILYDVGEYEKASKEYKWVVDQSPKSNFGKQSAQNLLIAAEKALPSDKQLVQQIGNSTEVIPLSPEMENFVNLSQWFLKNYPQSDKEVEVLFRLGRVYYLTNHYQEAREYFKLILEKYPKSEQAEFSANLLLDIFNLQKDYASIEKEGLNLLNMKGISSSRAGKEILNIVERSKFKKAQDLEQNKNYELAALEYLDFTKKYPLSALVSMSLFNAAVNFQRAGNVQESKKYYQGIVSTQSEKSKDQFYEKSLLQLADLEKSAGRYEKAAILYQKYGMLSPTSPQGLVSLSNSATLFEALGSYQKSSESYLEIINSKKSKSEVLNAQFQLGELYRKSEKFKTSEEFYLAYISNSNEITEKLIKSRYWVCQFKLNSSKEKDFQSCLKLMESDYKNSKSDIKKSTASYFAKLKLVYVKNIFLQLTSLRFNNDSAAQQKTLKEKIEIIKRINDGVAEVIKLDSSEEIIEALVMLGESNQHLYDSLVNAPLPKGLGESKVAEYRKGVEDLAIPFRQKAVESFKLAVEKGKDLQVYSTSFMTAYKFMSNSNPNEFKFTNELSMDLRLMNWIGLQ
ncbi:MAG TPA: tetratricopeptide repeat protein [Pseudobdellovibrionaceae bacterium]|nr:tetratricopeptide repeat protein [Pseudobdellovibrionaceae bacterium]